MDRNDQNAIESLFGKLAEVERQATPRDGEAEAYIRDQIARQPGAPYYMAQTIVVQEQALNTAQRRIEELEEELASRQSSGGGLFSGVFGDRNQPRRGGAVPRVGRSGASQNPGYGQQGGGFLAGAAQTAMGVAGGLLLGSAIGGMFGGGEAEASGQDADSGAQEADGAGADDSDFDGGGDLGGMDF